MLDMGDKDTQLEHMESSIITRISEKDADSDRRVIKWHQCHILVQNDYELTDYSFNLHTSMNFWTALWYWVPCKNNVHIKLMLKSQLPTPSTLVSHHIDSSDKFKVIFQWKEPDIRTYFLTHATSETLDPDLMIRSRGFLAIYVKDTAKDESFSFRMVPEKSRKKIATLNLRKEKARDNHLSQD